MKTDSTRPCIEDGCIKGQVAKERCRLHYERRRYAETKLPEGAIRTWRPSPLRCEAKGCSENARARGYCIKHYRQLRAGTLDPMRLKLRVPRKDRYREFKYGLSPLAYAVMRDDQDGFCAVCRQVPATGIDHDHETGAIRGLLCNSCNSLLGHAHDDPVVLVRAIFYLAGSLGAQVFTPERVRRVPAGKS